MYIAVYWKKILEYLLSMFLLWVNILIFPFSFPIQLWMSLKCHDMWCDNVHHPLERKYLEDEYFCKCSLKSSKRKRQYFVNLYVRISFVWSLIPTKVRDENFSSHFFEAQFNRPLVIQIIILCRFIFCVIFM